jgi:hypothetical protein
MSEEAQSSLPKHEGSKAEPELTLVNVQIPFPDTFVYSNCSAFSVSQMDIRISFAEAMPDRTAKARVGIVMPPEHAALLGMALIAQVNLYEHNFGPIRLPQWQSQKQEAIQQLLEAGMIRANPEASQTPGPHDFPASITG